MRIGSLFSGIGGIDYGFEKEGFETIWFIENNEYCKEVLRKHWPKVPIYGDIRKINFANLEKPDILTGGFPCQDISVAGQKKGITGKRSSLWKYYAKAICILRPRFAVIENVPNLANIGLNVVLADLAKEGYNAEWFTIQAAEVGAPHKRERIFIIAYPINNFDNQEIRRKFFEEADVERANRPQHSASWESDTAIAGQGINRSPNFRSMADDSITNPECIRLSGRNKEGIRKEKDDGKVKGRDAQDKDLIAYSFGHRPPEELYKELAKDFEVFTKVSTVEELFGNKSIPKPLIRRNDDGLPKRLVSYIQEQRIHAVGNAVVPQVAQIIARKIKEVASDD